MSTGKNVFIIGPGLIGWTVLDLLVAEKYKVTGLVRRQEHADGLKQSGAEAVIGDLHDEKLIVDQISKNDIVLHTATADDLPSVLAVLRGVREKVSRGEPITYIHTSGTSLLDDKALGSFKSDKIYHDDKQEEIDSLSDSAPHRQIDLEILKARKELQGKARIAIVIPPLMACSTVVEELIQPWNSLRPACQASAQFASVGRVVDFTPGGGVVTGGASTRWRLPSSQSTYVVDSPAQTVLPAKSATAWIDSSFDAIWAGV